MGEQTAAPQALPNSLPELEKLIPPVPPAPLKKEGVNFNIIIYFLFAVMVGAALAFYISIKTTPANSKRACTMDAKVCPDGSSVGRTGPNCEFSPCP